MDKLLWQVGEAATALSLPKQRTYQLLSTGELPGAIYLGKSVRLSRKAIEEWIDSQVALEKKERLCRQ